MYKKLGLILGLTATMSLTAFADDNTIEYSNSMEVTMYVDESGNTMVTTGDAPDVTPETYTNTTVSKPLETETFSPIYTINKVDSDHIMVNVKSAPYNGEVFFELRNSDQDLLDYSSVSYALNKGWGTSEFESSLFGTDNYLHGKGTVQGVYKFYIQW